MSFIYYLLLYVYYFTIYLLDLLNPRKKMAFKKLYDD